MIRLRSRLEELERDNSDLSSTLVKKEQDLEAKAQEKEDLQSNLERAKEKLELELQKANETRHRYNELVQLRN